MGSTALKARDRALAKREAAELNPFDQIPIEWVPAVERFHRQKANILKSPTVLCAKIEYWITIGLTLDDARTIFRRLCDPDVEQNHRWDNELLAELAARVNTRLRQRRQYLDALRRKQGKLEPESATGQIVRLASEVLKPVDPIQE